MAWVNDQFLAFTQCDLIYLPRCCESRKSSTCEMVASPVRWSKSALYPRGNGKSVTGPCEEGISLGNLPIGCAIEVENGKGCIWGFGGDQRCNWRRRGDALVKERHAQKGVAEWREEAECRLCLHNLSDGFQNNKPIGAPTFCTLPATVTSVPRRVYSFWEADRVTERSE